MTATLEKQVVAAEQQRCAAMLTADNTALSALLDPQLQFHHATGAVDDREAYLAKMAAGRIKYSGIAWSAEQVTALGDDAALLTGKMITDVQVEGSDRQLNNRVMMVWRLDGGQWRLLAFQSTPIAG